MPLSIHELCTNVDERWTTSWLHAPAATIDGLERVVHLEQDDDELHQDAPVQVPEEEKDEPEDEPIASAARQGTEGPERDQDGADDVDDRHDRGGDQVAEGDELA